VDQTFFRSLECASGRLATLFGADVNSADYRVRGAETELEFNLGHGFVATGTYTYTDAVVTKSFTSDNRSPQQPIRISGVKIGAFSPLVGERPFARHRTAAASFSATRGLSSEAALNGYLVGRRDDSTFLTDAFFGNSLLLPNRNLAADTRRSI